MIAKHLRETVWDVTVNVRDFVILDRLWREQGRLHSGISYLDSHAFRQDNSFMGHVQGALDSALRSGNLPDPGSCRFIAP